MRRRVSISSFLALGLALIMSANVAAASTASSTRIDKCTLGGGTHGYGYATLKASATEYGYSGVNQIKFVAFLLRADSATGPWHAIDVARSSTPYFANTSTSNVWVWKVTWNFNSDSEIYYHRIEMFIKFLDRDGAKRVVDIHNLRGKVC